MRKRNSGKYEIFCSFDSDMTGKSYVIYTEHCEDEEGKLLLHTGSYVEIDSETLSVNKNLEPQEFLMISEFLNILIEKAGNKDQE